jgi:putative restriction endonuclease
MRLPDGQIPHMDGLEEHEIADIIGGELDAIRQESTGGVRAVHKPLLLLFALARASRGEERLVSFNDARPKLEELLALYGRPTKTGQHGVHDPFWRLAGDGEFWEVAERQEILRRRMSKPSRRRVPMPETDINVGELSGKAYGIRARAGFSPWLHELLLERPSVLVALTQRVLDTHFDPPLHEMILESVGMHWVPVGARLTTGRKRDPAFRAMVLRMYEGRCAVCGFGGQLNRVAVGVEAAHVRWHAHGGPDAADNGLALCSLHHKALDLGAMGISPSHEILVSQHFIEHVDKTSTSLVAHVGSKLRMPISHTDDAVAQRHIEWHQREVFKSPARATSATTNSI